MRLFVFVPFLLAILIFHPPVAAQILPPSATPAKVAGPYTFTEGPLYDHNGGVYFSDLHPSGQSATNPSRIYRYDIASGVTTLKDANSGGTNGTFFNGSGLIVTADRERRQLSLRSASNIAVVDSVLVSQFNDGTGNKAFNGPNDLVIDSAGGIYFSDPDYENRRSLVDAVYYLNPSNALSRVITGLVRPNGVILSPSGGTFYVAAEGEKRILAYDVGAGGALSNAREFAKTDVTANGTHINGITNGPDGMTIDPSGNVYAAVQNAVWAWNPAGQQLFQLSFPEDPTNVEFGGAAGKTLFVTAGQSLYSIDLNVPEPGSSLLLFVGALTFSRRGARDDAEKNTASSWKRRNRGTIDRRV